MRIRMLVSVGVSSDGFTARRGEELVVAEERGRELVAWDWAEIVETTATASPRDPGTVRVGEGDATGSTPPVRRRPRKERV